MPNSVSVSAPDSESASASAQSETPAPAPAPDSVIEDILNSLTRPTVAPTPKPAPVPIPFPLPASDTGARPVALQHIILDLSVSINKLAYTYTSYYSHAIVNYIG